LKNNLHLKGHFQVTKGLFEQIKENNTGPHTKAQQHRVLNSQAHTTPGQLLQVLLREALCEKTLLQQAGVPSGCHIICYATNPFMVKRQISMSMSLKPASCLPATSAGSHAPDQAKPVAQHGASLQAQ
jgi:hypothetical protein